MSQEQFERLAGVDPTQRSGVGATPATDSPTAPPNTHHPCG